jgi:uncharacterized protein YutE (UPF0331/DUF86 family)/predicted nucleotidyltransferase
MQDTDRQLILSTARNALLAAFPNAWAIYVYGSFARGDESPASDIDLAVLLPEEENIDDLMGAMSAVSAQVHREVDLVDLRKVGDVLRREVLAEGHTLYSTRPDASGVGRKRDQPLSALSRGSSRSSGGLSKERHRLRVVTDVGVQKITSLQRCVARAREAYAAAGPGVRTNYNLQDAAILNVIRACDAAIDLANMAIRRRRLSVPNETRDSFTTLVRELIITPELGDRLKRMVGFRNLAVRQYRELNLDILDVTIRTNLDDLLAFAQDVRPAL